MLVKIFFIALNKIDLKKSTFLLTYLLSYYSSQSQSTQFAKGFDIGFKEGYCYNHKTVDCLTPLTPLPPLPRLNERQDSRTDGYNRGFQSGLDLQRLEGGLGSANGITYQNIPNYRFNEYISDLPVDAMIKVGIYKEELFNSRLSWIQKRVYDIQDLAFTLIYQFSTSEYDRFNKQKADFIDRNLKGKNIDWTDNSMFNQIVTYFKIQEKNIYATYNNLIAEANSIIIRNEFECNSYQSPIYVIKKNSISHFSLTQSLKDSISLNDFEFGGLLDNPNEKQGIIILYVRSNNAYYKTDANKYYSQQENTILKMNYVTNCDAVFLVNTIENSILILDKGVVKETQYLGIKTYKTTQGSYSPFHVYEDSFTNKKYFVSKNILEAPIHNKIYTIESK